MSDQLGHNVENTMDLKTERQLRQEIADAWSLIDQYKAALPALQVDAERWRWLVRHASLGFDAAPSWNGVVRLPVFGSDDQTITALVDRARAAVGDA